MWELVESHYLLPCTVLWAAGRKKKTLLSVSRVRTGFAFMLKLN